ncbi:hypothetical protein AB0H99_47025, partial [Streptomyces sp. NPDC051001]
MEFGVLTRRGYQVNPPRHAYVFTEMGLALCPSYLVVRVWGHRWLPSGDGPHGAGAQVVRPQCGAGARVRRPPGACLRQHGRPKGRYALRVPPLGTPADASAGRGFRGLLRAVSGTAVVRRPRSTAVVSSSRPTPSSASGVTVLSTRSWVPTELALSARSRREARVADASRVNTGRRGVGLAVTAALAVSGWRN